MVGHRREENDLKWESFRPEIEQRFVNEKQSLNQIIAWLGEQGFPVTKNKLNYRLNTVWRLRRRAPKGKAPEYWGSVSLLPGLQHQDSGSKAYSLALMHNQRRQRMKTSNLERQIKRYNTETNSFNLGLASQHPARMQVRLRSPTPERAPVTWPQDLPWLVSRIQKLEIQSSHQMRHEAAGAVRTSDFLQYLAIGGCLYRQRLSEKCFVSSLASEIPELQVGDAARRAKTILGNSERSAEERLKLLLLQISNNHIRLGFAPDEYELTKFDYLLELVEKSGLPSMQLALGEQDMTIRAVCDTLYQETFMFLWHVSRSKYLLSYDKDRARSLLEWLLRSGQDPNTPIPYGNCTTTGLQISLALSMGDLATKLLDCEAVPSGKGYNSWLGLEFELPPLLVAVMYLEDTYQSVLSQLEQFGLSQHDLSIGPYRPTGHKPMTISPMEYILQVTTDANATSVVKYLFDYTDERGNYRNMVDWKRVLIHATGTDKLGVLKFLLSRQSDICPVNGLTVQDLVNWADPYGLTAAHAAAAAADHHDPVQVCQFLLQNGAILENEDPHCPSLLNTACTYGCLDTVKFLHTRGALINRRCGYFGTDRYDRLVISATLQTPLERALKRSLGMDEKLAICKYLIDNGSEIPSDGSLVELAMQMFDVELISKALKSSSHVNGYKLPHTLFPHNILPMRTDPAEEKRLKEVRIQMAHLLLDAGAQVDWEIAAEAAFLGDWRLATKALATMTDPQDPPSRRTGSLLEAAILSCSTDVARKAFDLDPNQYDASALCAATLVATTKGGDFGLVHSLLNNRVASRHEDEYRQTHKEMSAVGIAAYSENWDLLQLLLSHIPLTQRAVLPQINLAFEPLEFQFPRTWSDGFWNSSTTGSVQVFSAKACSRIFNLFVNEASPLTARCLIVLIRSYDITHDRVWTLVREGHHVQQEIDYAIEESPLHRAIETGDISLVRACLDLGVDIDGCSKLERSMNHEKDSPLAFAIRGDQLEIAGLLIDRGANVNIAEKHNYCGMSPLHAACWRGHLGIVKRLLDEGADPNASSIFWHPSFIMKMTALEAAAEHGRLDITHLLLGSGVDTEDEGRLPYVKAVRLASENCHIQVQELLRSHRPWTKEDETLWNDPNLFGRKYYGSNDSSSADDYSDESDKGSVEGSAEAVSNRTRLSEGAGDTIITQENDGLYGTERASTGQQVTVGVDREATSTLEGASDWVFDEEHTWHTGGPFHGTVEDILDAYPTEREETGMLDPCHFIDWEYSGFNI